MPASFFCPDTVGPTAMTVALQGRASGAVETSVAARRPSPCRRGRHRGSHASSPLLSPLIRDSIWSERKTENHSMWVMDAGGGFDQSGAARLRSVAQSLPVVVRRGGDRSVRELDRARRVRSHRQPGSRDVSRICVGRRRPCLCAKGTSPPPLGDPAIRRRLSGGRGFAGRAFVHRGRWIGMGGRRSAPDDRGRVIRGRALLAGSFCRCRCSTLLASTAAIIVFGPVLEL